MIDSIDRVLVDFSRTHNFREHEKNCFDYRKEIKNILTGLFPFIILEDYLLIPYETSTYTYVDGRIFLKHAVLGVNLDGNILIMDPFLPKKSLRLYTFFEYVKVASIDHFEVMLIPDSVYSTLDILT
ncbi:MAG: hypothetical protein AABW92_02915 [Nanoarchaeota archaeon]